ncbi:hypothetical protein EJB05_25356 [Eragrostis curvula]|uniref:Bowman-Birk serine protease inhibitors family domain-containing protein n=1 Tax=Eragrostis curvula TaxID=38414 RepID=A0A5J9VBS7_9POAL|nr:hypothetical protein EJB05_25356 [Eragrostis curvula]
MRGVNSISLFILLALLGCLASPAQCRLEPQEEAGSTSSSKVAPTNSSIVYNPDHAFCPSPPEEDGKVIKLIFCTRKCVCDFSDTCWCCQNPDPDRKIRQTCFPEQYRCQYNCPKCNPDCPPPMTMDEALQLDAATSNATLTLN